ncbi:mitochondrial import receptor subunit TOM9-2-like [Durio zibethinus]|uniref:Mitochondrial import receptor subunit TOM9-2-like n=1 Tax=Durio zibethinus TaxID=66656 RepID=A0A6P5X3G5_DURZI|nr:mitochondrial import receptor subunit TOM9-2-like [Durio zibethinus]
MSSFGQGKKRGSGANNDDVGIMARLSRAVSNSPITDATKRAANDAAYVSKKLLKSTGKAAWFAGTTFLILVVPLIIEMDREQQFNELELQQRSLLGSSPPLSPPK